LTVTPLQVLMVWRQWPLLMPYSSPVTATNGSVVAFQATV